MPGCVCAAAEALSAANSHDENIVVAARKDVLNIVILFMSFSA
jgi:hypothetical protein